MKKICIAALCFFGMGAAIYADTENTTRRFGLFIGSNNGGQNRVKLRYAVSDAGAMAKVFAEMGGIGAEDAILLVEPTAGEINRRIDALHDRIANAKGTYKRTEIVFYYSGHSDEDGLLLNRERYNYKDLREHINTIPADMRIVILDSCSSGAFTRAKGGVKTQPFLVDSSISAAGYAFLTSSSATEASQESDRIGSSYFTHSLMAGLRGAADTVGDGRVTLNELYRFAYSETLAKTETSRYGAQHPSYDIQVSGSGDVVLTDIKEISAGLVIDANVTGRLSIRNESDYLVAEVTKAAVKPMELGLQPGLYRITLQGKENLFRAEVYLAEESRTFLSQAEFKLIAGTPASARGGGEEELPHVPFGLQIVPGIGIGTGKVNHDFLLGLFVAQGHNLDAAGFAAIGLIQGGEVSGVQGSVIFNLAGQDMSGLQISGVFNTAGGAVTGVQKGGVFNTSGGDVLGMQTAGVFNVAGGNVSGIQTGGILNVADGNVKGVQIAGLLNYTGGDFRGVQAGLVNLSGGDMEGFQLGLFNRGGSVQAGLVNVSDNEWDIPFGAVNIVKNGIFNPVIWYDSMNFVNAGLKSGSKYIYSLLSAGTRKVSLGGKEITFGGENAGDDKSLVYRIGLGAEIPLGPVFIDFDILYGTILNLDFPEGAPGEDKYDAAATQILQARLSLGFKGFSHLSVFAGISYDYLRPGSKVSPNPKNHLTGNFDWSDSKNLHRMGVFGGIQF